MAICDVYAKLTICKDVSKTNIIIENVNILKKGCVRNFNIKYLVVEIFEYSKKTSTRAAQDHFQPNSKMRYKRYNDN